MLKVNCITFANSFISWHKKARIIPLPLMKRASKLELVLVDDFEELHRDGGREHLVDKVLGRSGKKPLPCKLMVLIIKS